MWLSLQPALAQRSDGSVLRAGTWLKIGVTQTGICRLDYDALLRANPAFTTADPRMLRLYGNGGAPLPQANAAPRPTDLTENAMLVTGEADGRFDRGDALLFFGQSPHVVRYDSTTGRFAHAINPYADTTFYFLTIGTDAGRRLASLPVGTAAPGLPAITQFDDYVFREDELTNVVRSGRAWFGTGFSLEPEQIFTFELSGRVPGAPLWVSSSVVGASVDSSRFVLSLDGQPVSTQNVGPITSGRFDRKGLLNQAITQLVPQTTADVLRFSYRFDKRGQAGAQGYLNFLGVQARRSLRHYAQPTWIRRAGNRTGPGRYVVAGASERLRIWDVTDPLRPARQEYALSNGEASWTAGRPGAYYVFTEGQAQPPASIRNVVAQNLRAAAPPDLLIITAPAWRDQAERLADFRRSHDRLTVLVATTSAVFNEFASGQPDPTALRDFCRHLYAQQPGRLRYVLLFGDATYDFRNRQKLLSAEQLANTVPTYESRESLHPVFSFSSDDYFGFMQPTDGEWAESSAGDHALDLGVGRLPVKTSDEARTVVDKLIHYATDRTRLGDWRTRVALVADDGDYNIHQTDAHNLARDIETGWPTFRPERIFLDDFPQAVAGSPPQEKAPGVNATINRMMDEGRLIINYTGHGGESGWAQEQVLTLADIFSWRNRRLPLLVTATCEFGRYDDPGVNSGAELALLSRAGAVALLTTARPVFANTNFLLNDAFYRAVFKPDNGQMPRLGDVLRITKNNSLSGSLNRNFTLLGDPSMRLAYPQAQVRLTQVNGRPLRSAERGPVDTLRAQQTVELAGEIAGADSARLTQFTGTVRLVLYDKPRTQTTRGTESARLSYQTYSSTLFSGQVPVQAGQFRVRFTLPKDTDPAFGRGRLVLYAVRADSLLDAAGADNRLVIGGSVRPDSADTQPPTLTLAVTDATTLPGAGAPVATSVPNVVGPDVWLRVQLRDNQGINLTRTSFNRAITARLAPGAVTADTVLDVTDYYVATDANGRAGEVSYLLRNLQPGQYVVRVRAFDVNNNAGEGALTFKVSAPDNFRVVSTQTYPNPFQEQTTLVVEQNRPGESLRWTVEFFDLRGRLLTQQTGTCTDCPRTLTLGTWDGRSAGTRLPNGLYVYRVLLRSDTGQSQLGGKVLIYR